MATRAFAGSTLAAGLLTAGATLALAAAGSVAAAQDSAQADSQQSQRQSTGSQSSGEHSASHSERHSAELGAPPTADVKPFESAKLSLTQALADAQHGIRGKILAARFEVWHGMPVYVIRSYSANQIWETRIDANTGQAISQPTTIAQTELGSQLKKDVAALQSVQTTLPEAVSKAEQHEGGKVIGARLKPSASGDAYSVDVVKNGQLHTAMVDAQSGQVR